MKKILNLLMVFGLLGLLTFSSCEDEVTDLITGGLKVTITPDANNEYFAGKEVVYQVEITSNNKLKMLTITATVGGSGGTPQEIELSEYSKNYPFHFTIPNDATGKQIVLSFNVEDKAENITKTETITVGTPEQPLGTSQNGEIFHILGSGKGAWDLVTNTGVSEGGAANRYLGDNKDMINREHATAPDANFVKEIVAGNATRFVTKNDLDYANVTLEAAKAAYAAGTPKGKGQTGAGATEWNSHEPVTLAKGDILVAKLRGAENYAVIKIEDIVGSKAADGKITFTYKKQAVTKGASKNSKLVYY